MRFSLTPRTTPDGAYRYMLPVDVGTPAQSVQLLLDTGSHLVFIRDEAYGACESAPAHGRCFNSSASTSIELSGGDITSFSYVVDVDVLLIGKYKGATDNVDLTPLANPSALPYPLPTLALPLALLGTGALGMGPTSLMPYFWADAAGVLGISHQASGPWESLLEAAQAVGYTLDINGRPENGPSYLTLLAAGAPAPAPPPMRSSAEGRAWAAVGSTQWSSLQLPGAAFQMLDLYGLSVCGADLLGKTSASWPALVDTGSSCLTLPSDMFTSLLAWSPNIHCAPASPSEDARDLWAAVDPSHIPSRRCYLPAGLSAAALPVLTFSLSQYGGPKNLSKEQRGLIDMAQSGLNSRFSDMFKAFQYVDLDRSGKVNAKEISRALDLWNIPIDADKLDQIMAGCDHDGDGEITYNEFVDALARDTVAPAAMGKRDMQSLEAMGVPDLDDQFLLKNRQKKFVPTINAKSSVVEERRGAGEVRGSTPQAAPAKRGPAKGGVKAKGGPAPAAPAAPAVKLAVKPAAAAPRQQAPPGPKVLTKEQRGLVDMAQSGLNSRFSDMFKAFQYVDLDRSGKVNKREIARALDLWNIPIDADKLDEIMNACDQDGDGEITYAEFVDALARDTVAPAAMGKRDMQSLEAMGVPDLDDQFLLKNRQKKFVPTMNEKSYVVEERRGADEY